MDEQSQIVYLQVKAEVFRICRNFQDKGSEFVIRKIQEDLGDAPMSWITQAINELYVESKS